MGRGIIFIFLVISISVDLCASDCSCSDYLSKSGYGQCKRGGTKVGGALFCYVNMPSSCTGLVKSGGGLWYSAEPCNIQLGVEPIQGTDGYVEYYPGNMNLILSAPHGGYLKPNDFGPRVENGWTSKWGGVNLKQDMRTKEIAMGIVKNYEDITGRRPHLIVNNLHRSHLDPNRDERIGTQYIEQSLRAYKEYHDFITQARLAAAPPQLRISSTGPSSTVQSRRMGDYYLSNKRYNNFPVYVKVNDSQHIYVNSKRNWVVGKLGEYASLLNTERASSSPPTRGWKYLQCEKSKKSKCRWVKDPDMLVEDIAQDPAFALLLDIHGQAHEKNATEIGYALSKDELNDDCKNCKAEDTNIWSLIERTGEPLIQMLHGDKSLGSLFNDAGYKAVPSRDQEKPEDLDLPKYFNGGFTVSKHGSSEGGSVDAIQMELPGELTTPSTPPSPTRDQFVLDLVHIIRQFYLQFYDNQDVQSN